MLSKISTLTRVFYYTIGTIFTGALGTFLIRFIYRNMKFFFAFLLIGVISFLIYLGIYHFFKK